MEDNNNSFIDFNSLDDSTQNNNQFSIPPRKVFARSNNDIIISGTCAGFATYLNISPLIVRITAIISVFFGGWGLIIYLISALILPINKIFIPSNELEINEINEGRIKSLVAGVLIFAGLYTILNKFHLSFVLNPNSYSWNVFIPFGAIAIALLISRNNRGEAITFPEEKVRLVKSISNKYLRGVCGGLANYFDLKPEIIRTFFVLITFITAGLGILIYILLDLGMERNDE
ncbi:MAG: PspC domain-containing protein [Melioribacteraceae bacterium]|nr:PspC domain-containing protein [Melioribacteraceae bacterium]